MHKIRYYLAAITLMALLNGFSFLGSGTLANMVASHQSSAITASVVGKATGPSVFIPYGPCPNSGAEDC